MVIDKIKYYIFEFFKIIAWPFIAIINVIHYIIDFFNICGKGFIFLKKQLISLVKTTLSNIKENIKKRKRWKKFLSLLGKIAVTNIDLMHGYLLGGITGVLVVILQTISFFTTYGGTSYYFSDIGKWVPFAFAFVIQCTIVTFSFRLSNKTHNKIPQKVLLTLAVVISILFSYVGTINSAIEPYEEFAEDYKNFEESFYIVKEKILDDETITLSKDGAIQEINNKIGIIKALHTAASSITNDKILELDVEGMIKPNQTEDSENLNININMDETTRLLMKDILEDQKTAQSLKDNIKKLGDALFSSGENLKSCFSQSSVSDYVYNNNLEDFFTNYNEIYSKALALHNFLINKFSDYYKTTEDIYSLELSDLKKKMENYTELSGLQIKEFKDLTGNTNSSSVSENAGVWHKALNVIKKLFSLKTSAMETYRSIVNKAQNEAISAYKTISALNTKDSEWNDQFVEFDTQYKNINNVKDATLVAFMRLFNKKTFNRAIIPAILAVLVDGGTVLISWAGQRRKYSYLYANTNRDYYEEELDLFEQVFIATHEGSGFQNIINENQFKNDEEFMKICHKAINDTINLSDNYLKLFKPSPWTVNLGCGIYATSSDLNSDKKYSSLTSLLMSFGYLIELNQSDFVCLQQNYYGDSNYKPDLKDDNYYFLRFRVENYLRQNISSVSIYARYFLEK